MKIDDYKLIISNKEAVPACRYIEGENIEKMWADGANCCYITNQIVDAETDLIKGKKYWIIEPYLHKNVFTNQEIPEGKERMLWFVTEATDACDEGKEWDFKTHKPIEEYDNILNMPPIAILGDGTYRGMLHAHAFDYGGKTYYSEIGIKTITPTEYTITVKDGKQVLN